MIILWRRFCSDQLQLVHLSKSIYSGIRCDLEDELDIICEIFKCESDNELGCKLDGVICWFWVNCDIILDGWLYCDLNVSSGLSRWIGTGLDYGLISGFRCGLDCDLGSRLFGGLVSGFWKEFCRNLNIFSATLKQCWLSKI